MAAVFDVLIVKILVSLIWLPGLVNVDNRLDYSFGENK